MESSVPLLKRPGWAVLLFLLLLASCGTLPSPAPTAGGGSTSGEDVVKGRAAVESIEILILESFPVQIHVLVKGNLPDGCTQIDQIDRAFDPENNVFQVEISTVRPRNQDCTMALVPFEETVPLDVYGLPAGDYTVDVNGVTGSFTLDVDNVPDEPDRD